MRRKSAAAAAVAAAACRSSQLPAPAWPALRRRELGAAPRGGPQPLLSLPNRSPAVKLTTPYAPSLWGKGVKGVSMLLITGVLQGDADIKYCS